MNNDVQKIFDFIIYYKYNPLHSQPNVYMKK